MAASTSNKLSSQDKKDFEKFTKFLIYKSLQIIVQSRLGQKLDTKSKPVSSGADWFNLAIHDIPEVHSMAKKVLAGQHHLLAQNVCVEISLRTAEGDSMVLETWYISFNSDHCDPAARICYTVYYRMGIALKSLFCVSRVTPAYRLSRTQGSCSEDYTICYRVYAGEPQFYQLGEGYKTTKVGVIPSPSGMISINLAYRTQLLISPHKPPKAITIEVKDDHFKPDTSPKRPTTPKPCFHGYKRESVGDDLFMMDGQDLCSTTFTPSPPESGRSAPTSQNIPHSQPITISSRSTEGGNEFRHNSAPEKQTDLLLMSPRVGAFAQQKVTKDEKSDLDDIPFLSLLDQNNRLDTKIADKQIETLKNRKSNEKVDCLTDQSSSMKSSSSSRQSAPDDFVMVELKTPFAGADTNNDLGNFYRECQGAPSLSMFEQEPTMTEAICDITNQLSLFETNMKDFDEFVTSLHESV